MNYINIVLAAEVSATSSNPLGIGSVALIVIVVILLGWMGYLFLNSRRSKVAAQEAAPLNLSQPMSDDELENKKLTRVLRAALFGSVLMAIIMPWYALNEPDRQVAFADETIELDIEEGAHWYSPDSFSCADCHGSQAGGGAAGFKEVRSGVDTIWAVPSLDDIFYRYDEEEVRHWIVFGREGTPMPANGLDGGGAMTVQEIDQVIAFLKSIQLTQQEAFEKSVGIASRALTQLDAGEQSTQRLVNLYVLEISEVDAAPSTFDIAGGLPDDIKDVLQAPGTCTAASAKLVSTTCESPGVDTDRDGLTDEAERSLTDIAATAHEELLVIAGVSGEITYELVRQDAYDIRFDPLNAFTNGDADLDATAAFLSSIETDVLLLSVTVDQQAVFFDELGSSLAFLRDALAKKLWEVDFAAVAAEMGVSEEEARLAVGLFNGTCARCHTAGYSAGIPFVQGPGTGAWGPSLVDGRSQIQFPDIAGQIAFVIDGTENGKRYGINGLGSGRMPSFGKILSERQIELIVLYERTL